MKTDLLDLIRQERRRRGWSMRAAANAAGVSNTTWSRVEAGAVEMTPHMVAAIAQAFDWPPDWEDNPPSTVQHPSATVAASDINDRLDALERRLLDEIAERDDRIERLLLELTDERRDTNDDRAHEPGGGREDG